ncbi:MULTISPECIES: hypothetical protein [unclassified Streptomyces]|uniref:hypothetical protein n=1 Tax=unclassified Streptomyces TaxID=2593676 RepID=UPI002E8108E6|nr:hypothetical protein [Streptomyces sp. NBC_00589]WTI38830.1 hypothetical protein OIC96_29550 [Streptomyces sp. NBC_00775]WUB27490.1 hypothetical protein OHA51_20185 [Streptomyces sp. NBC_00589]
MTVPSFTLHDSAKDPAAELWFAEPPGFRTLPLGALLPSPGSPAADTLRTTLAPFLDAAPNDVIRQQFIAQFAQGQKLLSVLREIGTVHCSIGLHRDDIDDTDNRSGQALISLFTISWRNTAVAPRAVTAARAVTSGQGHACVEYLELPCGPAALSENVLTPSAGSGLPQAPLIQIHAHLPHPDCRRLVVLTLSATAVARREQYRAILQQIAETVSFDNPLGAGTAEAR